ncbi:MAG TPA: RHS repeat-associated core domain-containing protein [Candidatus Acidoferrum sp.]|nr:RHS repeat-associated core domain-containing protein [Candidatus Acidoferrum sp.]
MEDSLDNSMFLSEPANFSEESYYRARYYDPPAGRFISEDPIRFAASINFYSYVWNDPILRIDPRGLIHQAPDGRLHDDPAGGLEVLCTKGRNIQQDIDMLQQSIFVRFMEIVREVDDADLGRPLKCFFGRTIFAPSPFPSST